MFTTSTIFVFCRLLSVSICATIFVFFVVRVCFSAKIGLKLVSLLLNPSSLTHSDSDFEYKHDLDLLFFVDPFF